MSIACPLCGSPVKADIGRKGSSFFVRCLACDLIRIDPHPTDSELEEFYRDYVHHYRVEHPDTKSLRFRSKVFPLKLMAKGNRFLDIGCNVGFFVAAARRLGCEAYGIDVSPNAIGHARRLWPDCTFFNETLEEFAARGETFDMVVCTEVIEHIRELHSFMRSLRAVLNPGAVVFCTTPDTGHFRTPKKRLLDWKETRPVEHVALFNRRNIRLLFERHDIMPFLFFPMHRANMRFYSRYSPQGG
ncbi:MAG TPA: class I SAM-dependent methyltransferase [Geobacteraceae bacterium]